MATAIQNYIIFQFVAQHCPLSKERIFLEDPEISILKKNLNKVPNRKVIFASKLSSLIDFMYSAIHTNYERLLILSNMYQAAANEEWQKLNHEGSLDAFLKTLTPYSQQPQGEKRPADADAPLSDAPPLKRANFFEPEKNNSLPSIAPSMK